ncbi:uncharacterized protein LOC132726934 [Ruditapes philippinarum]|uniref:uncharacterized protein LOC132726934 n=1 Tax=Ruditapes philippinarum TaxID=129788 RepID=UPI00295AD47A|nr:uncharacterized protein LOC132726934 [Ruditapes philippinarum]
MQSAIFLLTVFVGIGSAVTDDGSEFNDDIHYIEPETGGKLTLQSKGKLSAIIDLDQIPAVKRVLCKGNKILVALKKDQPDVTSWKPGQLVIGSSNWSCAHNVLKPESKTIYAKVATIKRPKDYVIELHTTDAGPLDMFERADIRVHYEQGNLVPSRHRRYLSNPLRTVLNRVDWNASFTENIPFNLNHDNQTDEVINLFKNKGRYEPTVDTDDNTTYDGKDFLFKCFSCHGYSQISYFFELKVFKVNNKAVVKKYTMEMDLNTHVQQNYSLYTDEEISLTKTGTVQKNPKSQIFQTEIANFKTFPPIVLTVDYSSQSNIQLKTTTKQATIYNGDFSINGRTVITQKFEEGKPSENDVSSYNWTVMTSSQHVDTNGTMNTTFAFFQNMTVFPALSWAMKDVDMNLGPPIHVSTRPTVNVFSTTDSVARCYNSSVSIDSNITVAETDFSVDAFGIHIWNVKLMNILARKLNILHHPLMFNCHADCHGPIDIRADEVMEIACLEPSNPIVRGDDRFKRLHQLWGDFILFTSEEASSSWCGKPGNPCVNCSYQVVGNDDNNKCADRMMNSDLATSVTRLAKFVEAEWPERKLIVKEAWDEPTSDFPDGKYGSTSVFSEGRAAKVAISKPVSKKVNGFPSVETDESILQRLSELAVCSKFAHVKTEKSSISMCVKKQIQSAVKKRSILSRTRRSGHVEHSMVKDMLENLGNIMRNTSGVDIGKAPTLSLGKSYPSGKSMKDACGAFIGKVSQDNEPRFKRLIEYPLSDVEFEPEGSPDSWCGVETRQCQDCSVASDDLSDHWTWCGTRTMHMRLAVRLQRLVVIAKDHVKVEKALTMNPSHGSSDLFMEGRAARISLSPGSSLTMTQFASKAILAGFDYVSYTSPDYLDVCVKVQDGIQTHIVQFPLVNLIGVPLPLGEEDEYDYPEPLKNESRKPLLFDVSTSANAIAEHFRLSNFVSPGKRFIRLDSILVSLLDLGFEAFAGGFYVISGSGYRPRSVNLDNIATRHDKEKLRFEMGQAVEIEPNKPSNDESLFDLAIAMVKVARTVRMQRIGIGIGTKPDRLYFELRPMAEEDSKPFEVWDSGNTNLFKKLNEIATLIYKGGTVVYAREDAVICNKPVLGDDYFYFNFDLDEEGHCWEAKDDFCSETNEHRYNASLVLQRRLTSAAGTGKLPRKDILPEIEDCIVNTCGGCPSAGAIWKQKVIKCTEMILRYLVRASTPFQPLKDKVSVFNTENHESAVHSQACHDGKICVENTQIYSLLMPVITATYKHDNADELLFGGADNPSPLLEIVEQELAWRAEGNVDVYIENAKDISALRNVIKILMMYNKKVNFITFHLDPAADEDDVIITLQRQVEQWSGSVCPEWSRLVSTPYTFITIPHERKRRSLERSKDRNKMKLEMRNWEVDWMFKS